MTTIRVHELTLSSSIVAYLKMLVTLGTLRHQLADRVRPPGQRPPVRPPPRPAAGCWPGSTRGRTVDRLFAGAARIQRALEFVEFLEGQEAVHRRGPVVGSSVSGADSATSVAGSSRSASASSSWAPAALLRARRSRTRRARSSRARCRTRSSTYGLLALLVILIVVLVRTCAAWATATNSSASGQPRRDPNTEGALDGHGYSRWRGAAEPAPSRRSRRARAEASAAAAAVRPAAPAAAADRDPVRGRARVDPPGIATRAVRARDGLPRSRCARCPPRGGCGDIRGLQPRVRFDPDMVAERIRTAPSSFTLHARNPERPAHR